PRRAARCQAGSHRRRQHSNRRGSPAPRRAALASAEPPPRRLVTTVDGHGPGDTTAPEHRRDPQHLLLELVHQPEPIGALVVVLELPPGGHIRDQRLMEDVRDVWPGVDRVRREPGRHPTVVDTKPPWVPKE